jgi:hypothetical protein
LILSVLLVDAAALDHVVARTYSIANEKKTVGLPYRLNGPIAERVSPSEAGASLSLDAFSGRLCHHCQCLRVNFVICSSAGSLRARYSDFTCICLSMALSVATSRAAIFAINPDYFSWRVGLKR